MDNINRIKVVLCENRCTGKWLAEQLGVNPTTFSKWRSNRVQLDLNTIAKIAELLEIDQRELLMATKG